MCHHFTPTFHTIKELMHAVIFLIPALTNTSPQRHYVISYAWFSPWIISHLTNSIIFKSMVLLWVLKWLLLLLIFFLVCSKPTLSLTPLGSLKHGGDISTIFSWSGQKVRIVWKYSSIISITFYMWQQMVQYRQKQLGLVCNALVREMLATRRNCSSRKL